MKRLIITICALTIYGSVTAQSFLEKKLAKLQAAATSRGYAKSDYEEAAKDSASNFLDGKEILKDSRNLSGIYYSKTPIYAATEGDKAKVLKKFLVNYKETPSSDNRIDIYNQYSYETDNNAKYVVPATFVSGTLPPSDGIMTSNAVGSLFLGSSNYEARKYVYLSNGYKKDLQNNVIPDGESSASWHNSFVEIESGIILIGNVYVYSDNGQINKEKFDISRKYHELTVLYKPGKEALAAKYTREYCWDQLVIYWKKFGEASEKAGYRFTLASPSPAGIIPEHQKMRDVAGKLFEEAAKAKGYPIKVLYVYSAQRGPYFDAIKSIRAVGAVPMQVNIGRSVDFYVVFENLKPAEMKPNPWYAPNKYGYTSIAVGENMRDDLYNINEFTGVYYLPVFSGPFWLDASENAMKFKGK